MWLWKREECKNPSPDVDVCEKYISPFQTTGIPLIIGLSLFAILGVILFIIVRRKRRSQHAQEAEKHANIDDGIELEFSAPANAHFKNGRPQQQYYPRRPSDEENPFDERHQQQYQSPNELPPKY